MNATQRTPIAKPTHCYGFDDGSFVSFQEDGSVSMFWKPHSMLECDVPPVPKSLLYYWQVIRNRPEIKTFAQIKDAEDADRLMEEECA